MRELDFSGKVIEFECFGCDIQKGNIEIPGGIIIESESFIVHQDPFIPVAGFLVFSSKRHIGSIVEMTMEEYDEFFRIVEKSRIALQKTIPLKSITVVQEDNSEHFNLWFFPWTEEICSEFGDPDLQNVPFILETLKQRKINIKEQKILLNMLKLIKKNLSTKTP
jgi:hypothetical protein